MSILVDRAKAALYLLANIISGVGIVFANKAVFSLYRFHFIYALTFTHAATTAAGMSLFCTLGLFQHKRVSVLQVLPLAATFVGYIVFWNLSLKVNQVGFYQLSKIMITPTVVVVEFLVWGKVPSKSEQAAIAVLCIGVSLATVTDPAVSTNVVGLAVGGAAILFTAIYQVWAGSKQQQLQVSSLQLVHQYSPMATLLLAVLVPVFEPLGLTQRPPHPDTLLGFPYSVTSVTVIALTAVLGLVVSASTFLVIGATSSLTFNVSGHTKTVLVIIGGVLFFGERMPVKRLFGVVLALIGMLWYSWCKLNAAQPPNQTQSPVKEVLLPTKTLSMPPTSIAEQTAQDIKA